MTENPEIAALRGQWNALFDEVLQAGVSLGQSAATTILQETLQRLGVKGVVMAPVAITRAPEPDAPLAPPPRRRTIPERAPAGFVQSTVQGILERTTEPLTPTAVRNLAAQQGHALKDSSVRMALFTLRDQGKAQTVDGGAWLTAAPEAALSPAQAAPEPGEDGQGNRRPPPPRRAFDASLFASEGAKEAEADRT